VGHDLVKEVQCFLALRGKTVAGKSRGRGRETGIAGEGGGMSRKWGEGDPERFHSLRRRGSNEVEKGRTKKGGGGAVVGRRVGPGMMKGKARNPLQKA